MLPSRRFFVSCVSTEFRTYREELRGHLTGLNREVKIQEDFALGPATLLEKLDDYIRGSSAVLHLVGNSTGSKPKPAEVRAILARYADFTAVLSDLAADLDPDACPFTYSQWEAFLAIYHRIPCFIYLADKGSVRETGWIEDAAESAEQERHRSRLRMMGKDRATFPFADAKDVALSFYKSYESEASETGLETATDRRAPVQWPVLPRPGDSTLADREEEFENFLDLITGEGAARLLIVSAPSDYGKSTLLAEFERVATNAPPLRCARGDFKNALPLREVLTTLYFDLSPTIQFPRFQRELDGSSEDRLRTAFLRDLGETSSPVVLILDTYEQATDEAQRWVEDFLFRVVVSHDRLRVVVAGQKVPPPNGRFEGYAARHALSLITDPAHWLRFRERLGVTCTDDELRTLVAASAGSPRLMGTLLSNWQRQAAP